MASGSSSSISHQCGSPGTFPASPSTTPRVKMRSLTMPPPRFRMALARSVKSRVYSFSGAPVAEHISKLCIIVGSFNFGFLQGSTQLAGATPYVAG
ncbi:hypothetical protein PT974_07539 [Cladobotryum mycophilum]|uniref:Uncharacterized protein n=1 Tax=Cladobotryum mycophilum TaxID=491253 RepID=A0ABR0SPW8_9HYPO